MQRWERNGPKQVPQFLELEVAGRLFYVRKGRVGTDGSQSTRRFSTRAQALQKAQEYLDDHQQKGYSLVLDTEAAPEARNPQIEQAILEQLEDPGQYLVYADWLQAQGSPRGELITLQSSPNSTAQTRVEQLFKAQPNLRPKRMHELGRRRPRASKSEAAYPQMEWAFGFIKSARIARPSDKSPYTLRELANELLFSSSARFLQTLVIGADGDSAGFDYRPVVEVLLRAKPRALQRLVLAELPGSSIELNATQLGPLDGLMEALPNLRSLTLRGGTMSLDTLEHEHLQDLRIEAAPLSAGNAQAVGQGSLPMLSRLSLSAGQAQAPIMGALLDAQRWPALRHLAITQTETTEVLLEALLNAPLLRQLQTLDLSAGSLDDAQVERLLSGQSALEHLEHLDLSGNFLSAGRCEDLQSLAQTVDLTRQRRSITGVRVLETDVLAFSPDDRSVVAAKKYTRRDRWPQLGQDGGLLWGECSGSQDYECYVEVSQQPADQWAAGCICPSVKRPCKHVVALLMMAARGDPIPQQTIPEGLVMACDEERYDEIWE